MSKFPGKTEASLKGPIEQSVEGSEAHENHVSKLSQSKKPASLQTMTVVPGLVSEHELPQNLLFERNDFDKIKFIHEPLTDYIEEKPHLYPANKFLNPEQYKRAVMRSHGMTIPPAKKKIRLFVSSIVDYFRALHHCRYNTLKNVDILFYSRCRVGSCYKGKSLLVVRWEKHSSKHANSTTSLWYLNS